MNEENQRDSPYKVPVPYWDCKVNYTIEHGVEEYATARVRIKLSEPIMVDTTQNPHNMHGGKAIDVLNEIQFKISNLEAIYNHNTISEIITKTLNELLNSPVVQISFDTVEYAKIMEQIRLRDMIK